ncbi:MAG: ABC transporter substrate-binding protein [Chlamydiales bacterium]
MRRKSFGFFRSIATIGIFLLLGMVWWSSTLVEKDLKLLRSDLELLRKETANISRLQSQPGGSLSRASLSGAESSKQNRAHIDSAYPNLMEADPFFQITLPSLLSANFHPCGIRKEAMIGRPEHLHPFNSFRDVSNMTSMCTGTVAELQFGKYETIAPDLALKIEARPRLDGSSAPEYWVYLRDDIFWAPLNSRHFPDSLALAPHFFEKHRVTAHDFKFFYDAVMNPYVSEPKAVSLRTYYNDVEEFQIIDDYTFIVRWKVHEKEQKVKYTSLSLTGSLQPLASFVYQYFADGQKIVDEESDPDTYRKNSIWAQNFAHHWAKNVIPSCGPYLFDGMDEEGVYFARNPDYHDPYAVLVNGVHYYFRESFDAVWQDFKAGNLDVCYLSPSQLLEYENFLKSPEYATQQREGKAIHSIDYVDRCFYYLGWNVATKYFSTPEVRRALTMSIDRQRIIVQNLNEMAVSITGPFFCYSSAYDTTVPNWPYNPTEAERILEREGWVDTTGDGIRDKLIDGKRVPFRFRLCYFVKSLSAKVIAEYIATSFKEIGIDCQLYGLDITDLSRQFDEKSFDAIFMGWKLGTPPDDPRQIWHSSGAKEKGSSNAIGYANIHIDEIIDSLNYESDHEKRKELYHQFHQIVHEEAPYTFLYTPKIRLLYRDHVKNIFIPRERQDLIPGADIPEPNLQVVWIERGDDK